MKFVLEVVSHGDHPIVGVRYQYVGVRYQYVGVWYWYVGAAQKSVIEATLVDWRDFCISNRDCCCWIPYVDQNTLTHVH